ncbi:(Citrate (pro-3S)-lyase) ligase [Lactococcus lactis subsp. lactis]|uniref:[citrate (pro-3S)-lyase] ligase n=1 Tax=Lactococcus lactis TaxID=1358 RepID=UPI0005142D64|nr:[citrate (pro-3S)-lyase] ligase [Lactococcus lactis]KGF76234.1 Citrate pro-3S-lyase ligase [Lactococcus lactis]KST92039.1 (Citrate (pro-3S)-lyase) ligase [Lactococcus lactis subsp. lactis]
MVKIQDIFLKSKMQRKIWQEFLTDLNIINFSESEIDVIDETIGIFDEEKLLGTGSIARNVIKYVGTCNKDGNGAARFNQILTALEMRLMAKGISHYFVFTKPEYQKSFEYVGFQLLADSKFGVLMEKGKPNIQDFLSKFDRGNEKQKNASIVMNANPFTFGHRYLVEMAAAENNWVYVFVVSEDKSLFTFDERFELVKKGLSDLTNVTILLTSDYLVSHATFPAYFIKNSEDIVTYQTSLDARLFKKWFVPYFNISVRYLGEEPLSSTTEHYNQALKNELEPEVTVKIIPRKKFGNTVISATTVRENIKNNTVAEILPRVPETTYNYILSNLTAIRERTKNGN